jgi:Caspase domain
VNEHDRAVLLGIEHYAGSSAEPRWIDELKGPHNDLAAVRKWLEKPDGGAVPSGNIVDVPSKKVRDRRSGQMRFLPDQRKIEDALAELTELPDTAYDGKFAGRRLYVYVSGHGLLNRPDQAVVIAADASYDRVFSVDVTSWHEWFFAASQFEECVLWVDACATRAPTVVPGLCNVRPKSRQYPRRMPRRFEAYAAGFNLRAVENKMSDGKWHGVFTYALLQALAGAVAGQATSEAIANYLRNEMDSYMREEQKNDPGVAREPAIGHSDPISFGTAPAKFAVTLRFPRVCVGKKATVTDGKGPPVAETVLAGTDWKPELEVGLYVAFVPELNITKSFNVSGGDSHALIAVS